MAVSYTHLVTPVTPDPKPVTPVTPAPKPVNPNPVIRGAYNTRGRYISSANVRQALIFPTTAERIPRI